MATPMGADLVNVDVVTQMGSLYTFPDVPFDMLNNVIKHSNWQKNGVLILVNVSGAVLSLPARIVKTIAYNGETQDVGMHELRPAGTPG